MSRSARRCSVYDGAGEICAQRLDLETPVSCAGPEPRTNAGAVALSSIMTANIVCARPNLSIGAVVSLLVRHHIGCIPVVDERRRVLGMITKFDIIEHLDAFMSSAGPGSPLPAALAARTADELMMPLALTLQETASVAHAAALMASEDLHHVVVVDRGGKIVGVVSTKDISDWIAKSDRAAASVHGWSS